MATNNLRYSETKEYKKDGVNYRVVAKISLNDECKNGHEDFSITGTLYEKAANGRNVEIAGGCLHEEILMAFPHLRIFVDLHLSDFKGVPIYPTANGYYHLTRSDKEVFMNYLRINAKDYEVLSTAKSKLHFEYLMSTINIFEKWQEEADKAITYLQELTGDVFESTAVSSHHKPNEEGLKIFEGKTLEQISEEVSEQESKIKKSKIDAEIMSLQDSATKKIRDIRNELHIFLSIVEILQVINPNCIYYTHTNKIVFNWMDSKDIISREQIEEFKKMFNNKMNATIIDKKS